MGWSPSPVILLTFLYKLLFLLFWTAAHGIFYRHLCCWPNNMQAGWLSGLRRCFKAPDTSLVLVRVPLLSYCRHFYTKYCFLYFEHMHIVYSTIIHAIDHKKYRQDGRVVWGAGLRHQSLRWCGFEFHSCHFVDIPIQSIVSFILNTCTWYLLPISMLLTRKHTSNTAEWSKLLV